MHPIVIDALSSHAIHRLANTTSITFHGIECEALLILLDKEGVCALIGISLLSGLRQTTACHQGDEAAIGRIALMIRFSLSLSNSEDEIKRTLKALQRTTKMLIGN